MGHSISGTDSNAGDGWIALFFYAIAFLLTLLGKRNETISKGMFIGITIMGLIGSAVGIYDIYNVSSTINSSVIGFGLYFVAFSGILIPVSGFVNKK